MMEETKTMKAVRERMANEEKKLAAYTEAHSIHKNAGQYVSCQKCGSRLARNLVKGECCPLCRTDLRSETTLKAIQGYKANIKKYDRQYADLLEKHKAAEEKKKLFYYSFYGKCDNDIDDAVAFLKKTRKPIFYTYGLKYRHPTTQNVPIRRTEAIKAIRAHWSTVSEREDSVHIQSVSTNDMW